MKSIKIILTAMILLTGIANSFAQVSDESVLYKDPVKRATVLTHILKEKLGLTGDQYNAVLQLNVATAKELQPVLFSGSGDWYAIAEQAIPIVKERQKKLALILTGEQNRKLDAIKKEDRSKVQRLMLEWQKQG